MSVSRRNWSALSSLARQWTMEDEEEVEREKRRRVKSSSTSADQDDDSSPTPTPTNTSASESAFGTDSSSEMSQSSNSMEQVQLDFVEMLRVRDERRRMRHVETLRQQKDGGEDEAEVSKGGGARVELLGDMDEEKESVVKPQPPVKTSSHSPTSSKSRTSISSKKHENEESSGKDPDPKPSSSPARKFVSSVSISLDKSPSASGRTTPMSPGSPSAPWSPREHWTSPCQSPSPRGAQSPVQNGHTEETGVNRSTSGNFEQANKPALIRQSSRTVSFRMMRKKEEDPSPLQRSSSVRMASKKFEPNTDQNEDENKASSFQRNSRQRISSRSIQEKMERLAQAAQKSELTRFPDVTQRTLVLLEEVSRKREIFEKEQQVQSPTSPGVSKQEIRGLTSGMSERINRWLHKSNKAGSSHSPADLRHVDISSKRSLFENSGEDSVSKTSPGKI
ncbi:ladinin-1 isoform X2 [Simochromis diagramma]|uniref:ladinin-1 isoform X2 n=1 Tax=Simochromis diagramma TaxID=43689 RepID=UPI001A7E300E|nr:ladinin-1 isoform X2 [Simochromis diagramma]